jgi:LysR family glycine cleavage system transcriptional activator
MARRLPPLNALLALDAVLRRGSVRRAAEELRVTPAAVSQHLKHIESVLATELFVRHPRGISLTRAAERLLPALSRGFDALEEAVAPLVQPSRTVSIVLSIMPSLARAWLVPLLPELRRRLPHLDLTVRTEPSLVDFDRDEADLAIRYCTAPDRGLVAARLFGELVFPVCSPEFALGPHPLKDPAQLEAQPLLHDTDAAKNGTQFDWDHWFAARGLQLPRRAGLCFSDASLLLDAAEAGLGVALGRSPLVRTRLREGRLHRPFDVQLASDRAYFVVTSRQKHRRAPVRELFDWFASQGPEWSQEMERI